MIINMNPSPNSTTRRTKTGQMFAFLTSSEIRNGARGDKIIDWELARVPGNPILHMSLVECERDVVTVAFAADKVVRNGYEFLVDYATVVIEIDDDEYVACIYDEDDIRYPLDDQLAIGNGGDQGNISPTTELNDLMAMLIAAKKEWDGMSSRQKKRKGGRGGNGGRP